MTNPLTLLIARILWVALPVSILAACGSTNIITAEKTISYQGSVYSLANVQSVSSALKATTASGRVIDALRFSSDEIETLLDGEDSVELSSFLLLDEKEVLYEQSRVDSKRKFRRLQKDIEKAMGEVTEFMAKASKTQLKL